MNPEIPTLTPEQIKEKMEVPEVKPKNNNWLAIFSTASFVLLALGTVTFLYYQNQQLKKIIANYQAPTPSPVSIETPIPTYYPIESASPSASVNSNPTVTSPIKNTKVTSPLTITGTVPAGWMFEGSFPIKLVDSDRNLVAQGTAKEVNPGSWQSGKPVAFFVTLPFSTTDSSGFLILMNDNPSGEAANSKTFEVPVKF